MNTYAGEPCSCGAPAISLVLDARGHVIRGACVEHQRNVGPDQLRPGQFIIHLNTHRSTP